MSDRYPYRNTSSEISQGTPPIYETPLGAQTKADAARDEAESTADAALQAHRVLGANEHPSATPLVAGFQSATDKAKMDTVQAGAEVNQNAFSQVNDMPATLESDTLKVLAGPGIAVSTYPLYKELTITSQGTSAPGAHASTHLTGGADPIDLATTTRNGLMPFSSVNQIETNRQNINTANTNITKVNTRVSQLTFNVRDYGATGDGTTDDTAAFKAAVADVITKGGTIFIPAGNYVIKDQIDIDISGYKTTKKGISIKGDNANTTFLINQTNAKYIFQVTGRHFTYFHMQNLTFQGTDIATHRGLHMIYLSEQYLENLVFTNLFIGIQMEDVVRCTFIRCTFSENKNGMYANDQISESTPNAIDFFGCTFYGNAEAGLYVKGGCNINFFGGTIETNGHATSPAQRWGARLQDLGRYGAGGATFVGTYFEGNANIADVWINESTYPSTYVFSGCTFNKFKAPLNNDHNIRVDAGSFVGPNGYPVKLTVIGCGFRDMGNTPSSDTKYIKSYSGGAPVMFEQSGNYYQSQLELPDPASNRVFATGRLVSLSGTPAVWRAFNVASVAKVATGVYRVNFIFPSTSTNNITTLGTDVLGFSRITSEDINGFRIEVYNSSGAAVDPGQITFITCE